VGVFHRFPGSDGAETEQGGRSGVYPGPPDHFERMMMGRQLLNGRWVMSRTMRVFRVSRVPVQLRDQGTRAVIVSSIPAGLPLSRPVSLADPLA
jgi:hypothetical protein